MNKPEFDAENLSPYHFYQDDNGTDLCPFCASRTMFIEYGIKVGCSGCGAIGDLNGLMYPPSMKMLRYRISIGLLGAWTVRKEFEGPHTLMKFDPLSPMKQVFLRNGADKTIMKFKTLKEALEAARVSNNTILSELDLPQIPGKEGR